MLSTSTDRPPSRGPTRLYGIGSQLRLIVACQCAVIVVDIFAAAGQVDRLRLIPGTAPALDAFMRIADIDLIAFLIVCATLAFWISRSLTTRTVEVLTAFTKIFEGCFPRLAATIEVANGDLAARHIPVCEPIPVRSNDEIAQIAGLHNRLLTAQEAALSTRQLALGIAEIDSTARALRDQAEHLEGLVANFIFEDSSELSVDVPRKLVAGRG